MPPSPTLRAETAPLATESSFDFTALQDTNTQTQDASVPEQDLTLCFVCMRWTTDAPECRGTFHGCDLQPALANR